LKALNALASGKIEKSYAQRINQRSEAPECLFVVFVEGCRENNKIN
jgi:hypothetical protein